MFEGTDGHEVSEIFSNEQLLQRRVDLHHQLGHLSSELCRVQQEYHGCIEDILETGEELRARGVDTSSIDHIIYQQHQEEVA